MKEVKITRTTPEIRIHIGSYLPWAAFFGNSELLEWANKSGADTLEWMAVGPIIQKLPIGPTHEVLKKSPEELHVLFVDQTGKDRLGSGHVIFNPLATARDVFCRKSDILRPGERIALYNMFVSPEKVSREALWKLEKMKKEEQKLFPVVAYPPIQGKFYPISLQKEYAISLIQTHPAIYHDFRGSQTIIKAVGQGEYAGVVADTWHMRESAGNGIYPFGYSLDRWKKSLELLHEAGVLKEVHVQPGRLEHTEKDSGDELRAMFGENPSYKTDLGQMLTFLRHDLGFMGPYTIEVDPRALSKIFGKSVLMPPQIGTLCEKHQAIADYIKRA